MHFLHGRNLSCSSRGVLSNGRRLHGSAHRAVRAKAEGCLRSPPGAKRAAKHKRRSEPSGTDPQLKNFPDRLLLLVIAIWVVRVKAETGHFRPPRDRTHQRKWLLSARGTTPRTPEPQNVTFIFWTTGGRKYQAGRAALPSRCLTPGYQCLSWLDHAARAWAACAFVGNAPIRAKSGME
jgi:hypothetical protein